MRAPYGDFNWAKLSSRLAARKTFPCHWQSSSAEDPDIRMHPFVTQIRSSSWIAAAPQAHNGAPSSPAWAANPPRAQLHRLTSQTIHQNQHSFSHTYTSHLHLPYLVLNNKTYLRSSGSGSAKRSKSNNPDSEVITHGHVQRCHTIVENTLHIKYWRLAGITHIGATLHGGKKELHGRLTRSITLCHEKQPQYHHHCHHMLPPVWKKLNLILWQWRADNEHAAIAKKQKRMER